MEGTSVIFTRTMSLGNHNLCIYFFGFFFCSRYVEKFGLTDPCDNINFVMRHLAISLKSTASGNCMSMPLHCYQSYVGLWEPKKSLLVHYDTQSHFLRLCSLQGAPHHFDCSRHNNKIVPISLLEARLTSRCKVLKYQSRLWFHASFRWKARLLESCHLFYIGIQKRRPWQYNARQMTHIITHNRMANCFPPFWERGFPYEKVRV